MFTVPSLRCRGPKCRAEIVFLPNRATGRYIPVNESSLSPDDRERIGMDGRSDAIDFDGIRHVRHSLTCKDQDFFTRKGRHR